MRVFLADAISLSFCGHDENKAQGKVVCLQIVCLQISGEPMQACIIMGGVGNEAVLADAITSQLTLVDKTDHGCLTANEWRLFVV